MATARVVVVTGASSGIGAALARKLGAQGHSVVLAARRAAQLETVRAESGTSARSMVCDVTHRDQVEELRDFALAATGRIDVWVNNAGRGIARSVLELTDEDFDEMMRVNAKSVLYGMQAAVPVFQRQGDGHVVNVSSFLGRVPVATFRSAYSAAKAAMMSLSASLRMDLRRSYPGVHVSCILPGMVTTEFANNARGGLPPNIARHGNAPTPQTPEAVADVIIETIAKPRAEVYTNPAQSAQIVARYFGDIDAYETS